MGTECAGFSDWGRIDFFWGDERCVPPDDEESNYHLARQALLSRLAVPERHIHRIPAESEDTAKAALSYEKVIQAYFPGKSTPSFDLVHLGMGEDGHAASLFPGSHWDESRLVVANFSPRHPFERISMTLRLLNAARRVIFVVSGTAKAPALKRIIEDPACDYPAKQVQPASGRLTWMADAEAASLLGST
jgi:6-phosphogluconolactonase